VPVAQTVWRSTEKTCATTAEQLREYCATIVLQLPSKDLSAYAYFVTALDTSARQSNEKFFTLFLAFALA
jgi:hypothetical protein